MRLPSKAFRRGLREGFAAPISLFVPFQVTIGTEGVIGAWKRVDKALKVSEKTILEINPVQIEVDGDRLLIKKHNARKVKKRQHHAA